MILLKGLGKSLLGVLGKGRLRRGRNKSKLAFAVEPDPVTGEAQTFPELDIPPPPVITSPVRTSVRLNSSSSVQSTPDKQESGTSEVEAMETDLPAEVEDSEEKTSVENSEEKLDVSKSGKNSYHGAHAQFF